MESGSREKCKKFSPLYCRWRCFHVPQRVLVAIFLHIAFQNAFALRVVLSVAITVMVEPAKPRNFSERACPHLMENHTTTDYGHTFSWPRKVEALVLYAFLIGNVLAQIPGGFLADKYGARWVLFGSLASASLFTGIFPFLTSIAGYWMAVVLRSLMGIAQGPLMGSMSALVSNWIPRSEQNLLGGIAYTGANLGMVTGGLLTGVIIEHTHSWQIAFYFWSCVTSLYLIMHFLYLYSYPSTHKHICPEELEYIEQEIIPPQKLQVPWKKILTNGPYLANVSCQIGHNYIHFMLATCLPLYMKDILEYKIQNNAIISAVPFLCMWICSLLYSFITGIIRKKQWMSPRLLAAILGPFSNIGSALCIVGAVYAGCSRHLSVIFYTVGMCIKPFFYCTVSINVNELSKNYGGTMFATANTLGTASGIFGNWLIGHLTAGGKLSQWRTVFWSAFGLAVVTSIIFVIFASSERQEFDYQPNEIRPTKEDVKQNK